MRNTTKSKPGPKRNWVQKFTDITDAYKWSREGRSRREILELINSRGRNYTISRQQLDYDLAKGLFWRAQVWHRGDFNERTRPPKKKRL